MYGVHQHDDVRVVGRPLCVEALQSVRGATRVLMVLVAIHEQLTAVELVERLYVEVEPVRALEPAREATRS